MAEKMTDAHRHVLQLIMKENYITKDSVIEFLQQQQNDVDIDEFIHTINDALQFLHFRISPIVHPKDKTVYYAITNQVDDEMSKLATKYNAKELSYFKEIIKKIAEFDENRDEFSDVDALNERPSGMSMEEAEKLLQKWIQDRWLDQQDKKLWFGVRTLTDLAMYLTQELGVDL